MIAQKIKHQRHFYLVIILLICLQFACQQRAIFPEITSIHRIEIASGMAGFEFNWQPEGQLVAYIVKEKILSIANLDGSNNVIVASLGNNESLYALHWSPDGKMLSYTWLGKGDVCANKTQLLSLSRIQRSEWCEKIVIYNLETSVSQFLPDISAGEWSPNGRFIAGNIRSSEINGIVVVDPEDKEVIFQSDKRLFTLTTYSAPFQYLAWSPDGQYLAYPIDDFGARDQGRIARIGTNREEIVLESANSEHYIWSPDSQELAYFRVKERVTSPGVRDIGDLFVHIYSIESDKERILEPIEILGNRYYWPAWSPDGRYIVLAVSTDTIHQGEETSYWKDLVIIDTETGEHRKYQIAEIRNTPRWLKWSPDGHKVFVSGDSEIVEINFAFD